MMNFQDTRITAAIVAEGEYDFLRQCGDARWLEVERASAWRTFRAAVAALTDAERREGRDQGRAW